MLHAPFYLNRLSWIKQPTKFPRKMKRRKRTIPIVTSRQLRRT